jgi:hypothetical protein
VALEQAASITIVASITMTVKVTRNVIEPGLLAVMSTFCSSSREGLFGALSVEAREWLVALMGQCLADQTWGLRKLQGIFHDGHLRQSQPMSCS